MEDSGSRYVMIWRKRQDLSKHIQLVELYQNIPELLFFAIKAYPLDDFSRFRGRMDCNVKVVWKSVNIKESELKNQIVWYKNKWP